MELVSTTFDKLELTVDGQLKACLFECIEQAKKRAQEESRDQPIEIGGTVLHVAETGLGKRYPYRVHTGNLGVQLGFRKPKAKESWAISINVRALNLAINGLHGACAEAWQLLNLMMCPKSPGTVHVRRVDVAIDIFDPTYRLRVEDFVVPGRMSIQEDNKIDLRRGSLSGRFNSLTLGSSKNLQLCIYDKRHEVLKKRLNVWWAIWNEIRRRESKPPFDPQDRESSQIWRFEFRVGKLKLRDVHIRQIDHLTSRLRPYLCEVAESIRCATPTSDTNRSRWPEAPIWSLVRQALATELSELSTGVSRTLVEQVDRAERIEMFHKQTAGCMRSWAALSGVDPHDYPAFAEKRGILLADEARREPERTRERMAQTTERFRFS